MKVLSRAGSTRKVRVSAWDLIFLWGIVIMGVSPLVFVRSGRGVKKRVVGGKVFMRVYPVFRMGLNTAVYSMWLI
jgi:hypothetical protein